MLLGLRFNPLFEFVRGVLYLGRYVIKGITSAAHIFREASPPVELAHSAASPNFVIIVHEQDTSGYNGKSQQHIRAAEK